MDGDKTKEGVSVKEIESYVKKHRFEVFLCAGFFLASFFSFLSYFSPGWSIIAAGVGAIVGALFSGKVAHLSKMAMGFLFKQEGTTQLILGIVFLIIAVFIPWIIFLKIGLHGGKDIYHFAVEISSQNKP